MAITSLDMPCDKISSKSSASAHSSKNSGRLLKYTPDSSLTSTSKCGKTNKTKPRSPYLTGDRVQLLSRVTEKRFVHKTNFVSSFPLAVNLYKANSDEFKSSKKATKKVKKSVLTLPNDPAPVPKVCTVSDMNDSEYCDKNEETHKRKVVKKRAPILNNRKARVREKKFEFYDRDAEYCSQLNIDLDCSSTDMMKNFNGDNKRVSNRKKILPSNKTQTASKNLNNVWAILRNMNRSQFRPSPPMSEENNVPVKHKVQKMPKKANHKDARLIETCRTQEFAYISSYELDKKPPGFSPSSSIDRITVIDNEHEFSKICQEFEKRLLGTHDYLKDSNNTKNLIQKNKTLCKIPKNNARALCYAEATDNKKLIPLKKNKKSRFSSSEQSKSEKMNTISGDRDSLISTDTLRSFQNKTNNDTSIIGTEVSFIGSDNSGSSKAELPNKLYEKVSRNDKSTEITVLNKEPLVLSTANIPKRLDPQQRKPRLVTTMPSSCMLQKITQTEIKRRLANMRFPIVVLGKDQVSSSIKVMNYDPPQFNGLDDHIWPYMIEWFPNTPKDTKDQNNILSKTCQSYLLDSNTPNQIKSKSRKAINDIGTCKQGLKDKRQVNDHSSANKKNANVTPMTNSEISNKLLQSTKKQKSIVHLKDKMLNFLYKKTSNREVLYESYENYESKPINDNSVKAENKVLPLIDSRTLKPDSALVLNKMPIKKDLSSEVKNKIYKYPWAKAKWASDFIENVMRKIRSGVYYTQDRKDFSHTYQIDLKEVSVQAGSICDSVNYDSIPTCDSEAVLINDGIKNTDNSNIIPGFNNTLPMLEIKTLNMNQIAVKHCVTNIMLQFDVTVPAKSSVESTTSLNKTLSLTPITITESQTKVYKCKTTILNAMLPAELCSILPSMMSNLIDSSKTSMGSPAVCPTKPDSWLSTIFELTRNVNGDSSSILSSIKIPTEIKHILEGRFSIIDNKKPTSYRNDLKIKYDQCLVAELLPRLTLNNLLKYKDSPLLMEIDKTQCTHSPISLNQSNKQMSDITDMQSHKMCTSMEVYNGGKKKMTSAFSFNNNNLIGMIEKLMRNCNLQINCNLGSYFDMLKLQFDGKNVAINMSMTNDTGVQKNISVTVSNLNVDSLYKAIPKLEDFNKCQMNTNNTSLKCIEYTTLANKSQNIDVSQITNCTKIKRKGNKPYRRYKSTNVPSGDKSTNTSNTPLNKITTIDDFFQILGSKKIFSSVFDGNSAKQILSAVMEMKNWISEINPKQALLILLLINKKETQNLVRFRPIILQGIAVNRITRASELDMEIQVIDRENLNKFPQFEGITYLPESVTDYENLLDELYWIAKTTASDYNKPFDESSERLLKSLLQKRKKLNPSYLRVMARYVGLGLVKMPTK